MVDVVKLFRPILTLQAKRKRNRLKEILNSSLDFMESIQKQELKPLEGTFTYHRPLDYLGCSFHLFSCF